MGPVYDCLSLNCLPTGVSNTQKLLISASYRIRAAVQPAVQTEKSMGLCAQVSPQSLSYADKLSECRLAEFNRVSEMFILRVYFS